MLLKNLFLYKQYIAIDFFEQVIKFEELLIYLHIF